jgi:two-component system sensor histidine kinase HydH
METACTTIVSQSRDKMTSVDLRGGLWKIVRPQDLVWILLFGVLAFYGPEGGPVTTAVLLLLGFIQVVEPKIPFFASRWGGLAAFLLKLGLWYVLMGWTEGIASSYYWIMLLPVMSVATASGLIGLVAATLIACGAYLSLLLFLGKDWFIAPDQQQELLLRLATFPIAAYFIYQLLETNRAATRKAQAAIEDLAKANQQLQEAEAAMRRSERLAALGQLSAGLAHELRNPLGTMKTSAEMLTKSVSSSNEVAQEMAGFISSEVDRTNSLITRFLDFARPLAVRLERTDLAQVIDRAVADVEKHSPPLGVAIYKNYAPDIPPFFLDGELMERVIYNLILNAAQASPVGGSVTVKTALVDSTVKISVIDRGSGIDEKHLENIFNPFFTTKSTGTGLGLAIVSKIVDEHGGEIRVTSKPGEGSVFRVFLPFQQTLKESGE